MDELLSQSLVLFNAVKTYLYLVTQQVLTSIVESLYEEQISMSTIHSHNASLFDNRLKYKVTVYCTNSAPAIYCQVSQNPKE
jgi:hypothetical protein